jgi:hypothetical protein
MKKRKRNGVVTTTNGTYKWSSVAHIFRSGVRVAQSLLFCVAFCQPTFVLCLFSSFDESFARGVVIFCVVNMKSTCFVFKLKRKKQVLALVLIEDLGFHPLVREIQRLSTRFATLHS